ncbi:RHS repeat-associated core domain-containing protein [Chryseobacterium pennipullorum]|uniref:Type IV secretion protein Rhs n=1 Tax=Chryseobacterium pennipullorum TaxID=2258963 RepID=A0A3D9B5E9_9FLAO|nr:RHS repeat-associated core domain-containing protein [Chryseobacterium pennipullorum]REC48607.1 type IV secretion protein Rhs [Chryseobacterium pennipullorum]
MKSFSTLILSLCSVWCFSQTILYQAESTSRTVQDPQAVVLAQGFLARSDVSNPFVAKIGPATDNPGGGPVDSGAGAGNPSGTTAPQGKSFHDTKGNIEVNGAGQLQFTLPIALPPGVKSVAPQVNLVYTSGGGNGIAGYGWNISGTTSISRTGKTIEKDGEVKGVQLDYSDYYAFNGQRLVLKSGEYGKDGAEYVTEKYSNIRIKSFGSTAGQTWQGPEYWEVTFEDGSQSWYGGIGTGNSTARTPLEYNIVKWKDAQGNYITYNYTQAPASNVALISAINWGGNEIAGKSHFNSIEFAYLPRKLNEVSYVKGILFKQDKILDLISVKANGSPFKSYSVKYTTTQNLVNNDSNNKVNYDFVEKIIELNSEGKEANPIVLSTNPLVTGSNEFDFAEYDSVITTGDYNGDGLVDFIVRQPAQNGRPEGYYLYFDAVNNSSPSFVYLGATSTFWPSSGLTTVNIKPADNFIKPRQGLVITKANVGSNPPSTGDIELKYYSIKSDASVLNTYNNPLVLEYAKTIQSNTYLFNSSIYPPETDPEYMGGLNQSGMAVLKEVDIDSDGMSELVLPIQDKKCKYVVIVPDPPKGRWQCKTLGYRYVVVDNDNIQNNTISIIPGTTPKNILSKGGIVDFDNDGKQDIMFVDPANSNVSVSYYTTDYTQPSPVIKTIDTPLNNLNQYELKKANNTYTLDLKKTFSIKGIIDGIQFGDLNGDKNIEVLLPVHNFTDVTVLGGWSIYLNTGNGLEESVQGLMFYRPFDVTAVGANSFSNPKLLDLDNDGKSEIVNSVVTFYPNNQPYTNWYVQSYNEAKYDPSNTQFKWSFTNRTLYNSTRNKAIISPVFGDFRSNNASSKILFLVKGISGNNERKIISYKHYSLTPDKNISLISQGSQNYHIDYKELDPAVNSNIYAPVKKEQYPFVEMDRLSQTFGVSQIRQTDGQVVRKQDFRYRGYIANLHGKGVMGFRQSARSSWYADGFENTKIWAGTEMDPLQEGVPVKEWSIRTNNENQIFPTNISENNTQLLSFKSTTYQIDKLVNGQVVSSVADADKPKVVTAVGPKTNKTKDFLTGTLTESTITYGNYYLAAQSVSNVNAGYGITTSTFEYNHNPSGIGSDYYIGRPKSKTDAVQAYGDIKSTKEEFTYENNLVKTLKTWNRDNTGYLLETYNYDGFGNITGKVISNSVDPQTQTTTNEYDPKGRFVVKKTDNLGLETSITYNNWGQVLTQTDPLGNVLTNTYDSWGKILTSKSNIEGTTTYQYERDNDSNIIVSQNDPDGNISKKFTNKLGQEYKSSIKAFGQGQYLTKVILYDAVGRKVSESELTLSPDGLGGPWNLIAYDDTVFPTKVTATSYKDLKLETSVSGLTTTIKELNGYQRTTSKTADALGNVISSTDKGGTIQFSYNAAGEQIRAKYAENIVTTEYDPWGRKSEFNDPSNGIYKYEYTGSGQIKKTISPKGTKEYTYNTLGQLISQKELSTHDGGQATNKIISFTYDNKGRVIAKSGTSKGQPYSNNVSYDPQGRLLSSSESSNGKYFIQKGITYDDKARIISYEKQLYSSGTLTKVQIENVYSAWSGELYQVKDKTSGRILWELKETNSKGMVVKAKLGAVEINNSYDFVGFLTKINHSSAVKPGILQISYAFDAIKNELKSRTTGGDFNIVESFDYDDNNRLVNWTNPVTGIKPTTNRNVYDVKGRITQNDQVGTIKFENSAKIYQPTGMTLNAAGTQNYNNDLIQTITYNENNDPVFIDGEKGDVAFQYGLTAMRQRVTYGGNFNADGDGKFTKYYSGDGSYEVIKDNITGKEKHVIYIGGTPYESNIVYLKNFTENNGSYRFLHKDYIGSILAISDEAGNKVEQRHFDAWGNFTHLQIGNGAIITDKNIIDNTSLLVDRGYTSHEHFAEIGIIHMNGRLYDPLLRRFLNADENIQDPYNTQNYNKYGYVLNNPLMFNDPSGEFIWFLGAAWAASHLFLAGVITAAVIGVAVGLAAYSLGVAISGGKWQLGGALKSMLWGGVSGAVTFGIGSVFTPAAGTILTVTDKVASAMAQGLVHGFAQGTLSLMQGANFAHGFAGGASGSWGASLFGAIAGSFANSAAGTVLSGMVLGGVGAELTGGNFWQGAVIGGTVAGLNHVVHKVDGPGKPGKGTRDWLGDGKDVVYDGEGYFGSNYIGPGPDVDPNELLRAGLKPLDMVDQAAFEHDRAYYEANTGGVKGALFEKSIAYADMALAKNAMKVINGYKKGQIDTITGQKISQRTYNMARLVYAAFKSIDYQKSFRINVNSKVNHFYNTVINQIPRSIR